MRLGIGIPYYKNSPECEIAFKKLMKMLYPQVVNYYRMVIYEDGQCSDWLKGYDVGYTKVISNVINNGVAFARNIILNYLIHEDCDYILFIDSDDMVDCDYLIRMYEICSTHEYDLVESIFYINGKEYMYTRRDNVSGCAIRTELIKDMQFDETVNVSEDTLFISKVFEDNPELKRFKIQSKYYYNLGINPNSLMMRWQRNEIGVKKDV